MLSFVKEFKHKNKVLIQNFSSLTILQFSNYLFPLITFPYLVRVLGPEKFGLVNFAAAFVMYFNVLTDYGFNLSATQEISINRDNKGKINEIFSSVLVIKLSLFFIGALIFIMLVLSIDKFSSDSLVYIFSFLMVFGTVLFPVWFFQGMEEMKYITFINVGVKTLWVIAVFVFIKSQEDVLLLVILNGTSFILIGLVSLVILIIYFDVKFIIPHFKEIKKQLTEGWYIFVSTASITLYTTSNIFILGLFANNTIVGYFAAADKIRVAMQGLFQNASQAIFPHLSKLFQESKLSAIRFIKNYLKLSVSIAIIITIIMFILAKPVVLIVLGSNYLSSVNVFRIIVFLPLIILLSNIYGIQIMLNVGYKKEFFRIILFAGIVNLILSFILVPMYFEIGTAIAVVVTELIVTAGMYNFVRKKKILKV